MPRLNVRSLSSVLASKVNFNKWLQPTKECSRQRTTANITIMLKKMCESFARIQNVMGNFPSKKKDFKSPILQLELRPEDFQYWIEFGKYPHCTFWQSLPVLLLSVLWHLTDNMIIYPWYIIHILVHINDIIINIMWIFHTFLWLGFQSFELIQLRTSRENLDAL